MAVFTQEHDYLAGAIVTSCAVCPAIALDETFEVPQIYQTDKAMWDTGANCCLISQKVVDALDLKQYGTALVDQATTESEEAPTYLVHIGLPTKQTVLYVEAVLTASTDYDVVIGMNVITEGDFAITNKDKKTVFSYQRPSLEHIRFENKTNYLK